MKIKLGVVGPGLIWHKSHKEKLLSLNEKVEIVAFCARTQETLDKAQIQGAKNYSDIGEFMADDNIDAVLVLTPIPLNAPTTVPL